jgi:hypothetical protein
MSPFLETVENMRWIIFLFIDAWNFNHLAGLAEKYLVRRLSTVPFPAMSSSMTYLFDTPILHSRNHTVSVHFISAIPM